MFLSNLLNNKCLFQAHNSNRKHQRKVDQMTFGILGQTRLNKIIPHCIILQTHTVSQSVSSSRVMFGT
jgi:hypothetical protein